MAYQCKVWVDGGRIIVSAPFALKDTLKSIPGRMWSGEKKAWTYPATATGARNIVDALGLENLVMAQAFRDLLEKADREKEAGKFQWADHDDMAPIPVTYGPPPWRHQLQAYHWMMNHESSMLYMGMGTGKTRTVIDVLVNSLAKRVIIQAPLAVLPTWEKEAQKYAPGVFRVVVLRDGSVAQKTKKADLAMKAAAVNGGRVIVVINYESAWRDEFAKWSTAQVWDWMVMDESHKIKSAGGKASKFCAQLARSARKRVCLTGTPMPHSPMDIYAQFRVLDPGVFGTSLAVFRNTYAVMGGFNNYQVMGWRNQDDLNAKIYTLAYRADRSVIQLPDAQTITRSFRLAPASMKLYSQLESDLFAGVEDGTVTAGNALTKLLRLQQITSGYVKDDDGVERPVGSEKADALEDTLEEIGTARDPLTGEGPEPIVVFCRFHHDLDTVHTLAQKLGTTSMELSGRRNQLAEWQQGGAQVLAVQINSGGAGVDLTRARYSIYYSLGFSLGDYDQSLARIHRPGQDRPCVFVHLIAEETVDVKVMNALESKRDVVTFLMDELLENRAPVKAPQAV